MAQTGITTAIGVTLESVFRQVPRTLISGSNYQVGVTGTNPERFMTVEPGGGVVAKPTINVADAEIDGSIELTRTIHTGNEYNGGFGFKFDPEVAYYACLGMFGIDVQTLVAGGGTSGLTPALRHDFTPGKYAPSFTVEEVFGDGNYGRLTSGYVMNSLSLDIGETIIGKFGGIGHRGIPNTYPNGAGVLTDYVFGATPSLLPNQMGGDGTITMVRTPTPTYVDVAQGNNGNGPNIFRAMTFGSVAGYSAAFLTIDDTAQDPLVVQIMAGLTHDFACKTDSAPIAGSGLDNAAVTRSGFTTTGKIMMYFKDSRIVQAGMRHSKIGLNYAIPGVAIGTSGQKYTLEVHIPHMKLLEVPVDVPDGPITITSSYVAKKDPAFGYSVKVSLINSFDNSTLSGGSGTTGSAGGTGGWSVSQAQGATLR